MKKTWKLAIGLLVLVVVIVLIHGHHASKSAHVTTAPRQTYLALGDSIAAGAGLDQPSDSSACERSNESYPNLVAKSLNYKLTSLACSGATIPQGILGSQTVNQLALPPQLQQLFAQPRPALITITIGANDSGWATTIEKCYLGTCGTDADTAAVTSHLKTMATSLQSVLAQITAHYNKSLPTVIVTSYYEVFPPADRSGTCSDLTGVTPAEQAWGLQQQQALSQTIQETVAAFPAIHFVPVSFSGHELCTATPWSQGLTSLAPYHPTSAGQQAYANKIIAAVRDSQKQ